MLGYITILIIFIVLTTGWFVAYIGLVYMNAVFTSQYLKVSDVPYYKTTATYPDAMSEYGLEWALFITEPIDFFVPWVCLICYLLVYANITQAKHLLRGYFVVSFFFLIIRFIYRIISYGLCDSYGQLCRSLNPADKTGYFETTNMIWDIVFWNNFAMIFWNIMLLALTYDISERAKRERDDDTRRVLIENGGKPHEIEALIYLKRKELEEEADNKKKQSQVPQPQPPEYEQPPIYYPEGEEPFIKSSVRSRVKKTK